MTDDKSDEANGKDKQIKKITEREKWQTYNRVIPELEGFTDKNRSKYGRCQTQGTKANN